MTQARARQLIGRIDYEVGVHSSAARPAYIDQPCKRLSTVGLALQLPFRPDILLLLVTQPMLHPVESLGLARMGEW